jgi:hypothetical protein
MGQMLMRAYDESMAEKERKVNNKKPKKCPVNGFSIVSICSLIKKYLSQGTNKERENDQQRHQ